MPSHLSKSLLNNYRQCPRRLWLEMQDRAARKLGLTPLAQATYRAQTQKRFLDGHVIGRIAKAHWPQGVDIEALSWVDDKNGSKRRNLAYAQQLTQKWLMQGLPLFEATFSHDHVLIMADVLRPTQRGKKTVWQMIEVKSSTAPKDYHITDLATQVWVAQQSGVPVVGAALMLVNKGFTLQTAGDYTGLLDLHQDPALHEQLCDAIRQVPGTIHGAQRTLPAQPHQETPPWQRGQQVPLVWIDVDGERVSA